MLKRSYAFVQKHICGVAVKTRMQSRVAEKLSAIYLMLFNVLNQFLCTAVVLASIH